MPDLSLPTPSQMQAALRLKRQAHGGHEMRLRCARRDYARVCELHDADDSIGPNGMHVVDELKRTCSAIERIAAEWRVRPIDVDAGYPATRQALEDELEEARRESAERKEYGRA